MSLAPDAVLALHRRGRFAEIVDSCFTSLKAACALTSLTDRLLLAEALLNVGETSHAYEIASASNLVSHPASIRSRCEIILGSIAKKTDDFRAAATHFHTSVRSANDSGDIHLSALSRLFLLRLLLESTRDTALSALLCDTRRAVTRAGDAHLTALLHDTVAILEGQSGRRDEARRHLGLARAILERDPNAWLALSVHTDAFCVAWFDCEFDEAAQHAKEARRAYGVMAGSRSNAILDVNQGHLDLMTGNFPDAFSAFQRIVLGAPSQAQLPARDGLARLYLALNDVSQCEASVLRNLETCTQSGLQPHDYYPLRWSHSCAARLAIMRCDWPSAILNVEKQLQLAIELRDVPLIVDLLLLRAEAQCGSGALDASSVSLFRAAEAGALAMRDQAGAFYDTCGRVLHAAGSALAPVNTSRALRIWRQQGNLWAPLTARAHVSERLPVRRLRQPDIDRLCSASGNAVPNAPQRSQGAEVLNCITAAFDLAYDAKLAAAELGRVASIVGCSDVIHIEERKRRNVQHAEPSGQAFATSDKPRTIDVSYKLTKDPERDLMLANIVSVAGIISEVANSRRVEKERAAVWPASDVNDDTIFVADEMNSLKTVSMRVAPTPVPVLLTGETGTGKEILARAIHAASTRAAAIFLPFNCAAGPRDMVDAQLFGHRRGAFTGAVDHAPGIVRTAAGGTLFLDEIGEAPLEIQPKLLRFLESGEIHPIGEPRPATVDVRIIAATNVDLDAAVSAGRFREDLFYRLNIVRLHLPPLRDRRVEIPVFAQHFLLRHARELGKGNLRLAEETMEYLLLFRWPGNVRQLANEMRRLAALAETDAVLMPEHLSPDIVASRRTVPASERLLDANEVVVRLDQPLAAATEHVERAMLPYALRQSGGRLEEAARMLGLSRKGLYLKRLRLGLEAAAPHASV